MTIFNTKLIPNISTNDTICEYAQDIWNFKSTTITK
jgi:hypothetical protein